MEICDKKIENNILPPRLKTRGNILFKDYNNVGIEQKNCSAISFIDSPSKGVIVRRGASRFARKIGPSKIWRRSGRHTVSIWISCKVSRYRSDLRY